jgi:hypothetical protein
MLSRRRAQPVHRGLQVMHAMVVLISFASGTHPRDGPRQGGRGTRAQQQSGWSIQGTGEGRLLHREGIVVRLRGGGGLKRGEAINFQTLEPVDMGMGSVDDGEIATHHGAHVHACTQPGTRNSWKSHAKHVTSL